MRIGAAAVLSLLVACSFDFDYAGLVPADAALADAQAPPDARDPVCVWQSRFLDTCAVVAPTGPLVIDGDAVYNTDSPGFSSGAYGNPATQVHNQSAGEDLLIVSVTTLTVEASGVLRFEGTRPAAIVASGTIDIIGQVDLRDGGAGANSILCAGSTGLDGDNVGLGGGPGGGGGGFQGGGGAGGDSDLNGSPHAGAFGGGMVPVPTTIRGGCPGGKGGDSNGSGGVGGAGGGALLLVSQMSITISGGTINAGGGGGVGATFDTSAGGGGGGSGGLIVFEAPTALLDAMGTAAANGGGGGEGEASGSTLPAGTGAAGLASADSAPGGDGGIPAGGNGGDGGSRGRQLGGEDGEPELAGGGGGGGGVGYFLYRATSSTQHPLAVSSPSGIEIP
jgi:hypothetical protein